MPALRTLTRGTCQSLEHGFYRSLELAAAGNFVAAGVACTFQGIFVHMGGEGYEAWSGRNCRPRLCQQPLEVEFRQRHVDHDQPDVSCRTPLHGFIDVADRLDDAAVASGRVFQRGGEHQVGAQQHNVHFRLPPGLSVRR